jgi:hypothetical protein
MVHTSRPVTGGVDTHLDLNVAAVLDGIGSKDKPADRQPVLESDQAQAS